MKIDMTTGEIIESRPSLHMALSDLRRPRNQRPAAWVHETHRQGYRVARPARRPRTYARARRPGREASLVVELAKAVAILAGAFMGMALLYAVM